MRRKIESNLKKWKNKSNRKPLILNGARQVGKTYILKQFGRDEYKNVVRIDLSVNEDIASYISKNLNPRKIVEYIEVSVREKIVPGKTLLIFDEIQACEGALSSLKYFNEDMPDVHVVAAGSLLGVAINRERYSFPVGKVETMQLSPMDFEEFLWALGDESLCEMIWNCYQTMTPMEDAYHQKLIELYRYYLIVGGMPEAVAEYVSGGNLIDVASIQNEILSNYIADMAKYATNSLAVKIRDCYNSIPAQLAKDNKKFQYKVVQKGGTATIFGEAIAWLESAGIVIKCKHIEHGYDPINAYEDLSSFKLYLNDIGLITMKSAILVQTVLSGVGNTFMGALTENYVATQLASSGFELHYWTSEYSAELDFVVARRDGRCAIEVKKGEHNKSKSLTQFINKYEPEFCYRLSLKNYGYENGIYSVPLYAVFCLKEEKEGLGANT